MSKINKISNHLKSLVSVQIIDELKNKCKKRITMIQLYHQLYEKLPQHYKTGKLSRFRYLVQKVLKEMPDFYTMSGRKGGIFMQSLDKVNNTNILINSPPITDAVQHHPVIFAKDFNQDFRLNLIVQGVTYSVILDKDQLNISINRMLPEAIA